MIYKRTYTIYLPDNMQYENHLIDDLDAMEISELYAISGDMERESFLEYEEEE